ncbi:NUDIX hydrolase [Tenacibaculum aquimarinum]|uniref:NUDIX hydrolase n=1 Tax=Tenacibaculum aquimarinum TaxID=2910675 RepID=UPI001F0B630C|nr:CoA pyrophosphatase [Tenacibaculum aquimarinum]MCH3884812.1 CoA pyrophosphatase [Tenacibaculum aquimarinum]
MDFSEFQSKINHYKTTQLGGMEAQFKLAPKLRLQYSEEKIKNSNPKKAAVLALFYPNENGKACFLLTERASYNGTHSGQISFPGGKIEKNDVNLQETALRETHEEVGVLPSSVVIIREITDVYIPPSNFSATPFMGFTKKEPTFIKNNEVANSITVLVSDLLNNDNITSKIMSTSYMKEISVPCFKLNNYIVWGATAMILSEIKELLNS